jgi:hypothetical protein
MRRIHSSEGFEPARCSADLPAGGEEGRGRGLPPGGRVGSVALPGQRDVWEVGGQGSRVTARAMSLSYANSSRAFLSFHASDSVMASKMAHIVKLVAIPRTS